MRRAHATNMISGCGDFTFARLQAFELGCCVKGHRCRQLEKGQAVK